LHVEQVTINADQECALAPDGGAQHRYIGGIPTQIYGQFSGLNDHGHAAKECGNLVSLTQGEAEFLRQFSPKFPEYKFRGHKLMMQKQVFQQLGTHACAANMRCN